MFNYFLGLRKIAILLSIDGVTRFSCFNALSYDILRSRATFENRFLRKTQKRCVGLPEGIRRCPHGNSPVILTWVFHVNLPKLSGGLLEFLV